MPDVQVTCVLPQPICFCRYRSCTMQAARARTGKVYLKVTRVLYQLKIHWGYRSSGVPAARARGEEAVLTWGPPMKVNFELATPNSGHWCTLARPTWRRMKKGAKVHSARAVHVQVF